VKNEQKNLVNATQTSNAHADDDDNLKKRIFGDARGNERRIEFDEGTMETGMKSFNLHRNQKYKNKI
jgi:hypothetical protein